MGHQQHLTLKGSGLGAVCGPTLSKPLPLPTGDKVTPVGSCRRRRGAASGRRAGQRMLGLVIHRGRKPATATSPGGTSPGSWRCWSSWDTSGTAAEAVGKVGEGGRDGQRKAPGGVWSSCGDSGVSHWAQRSHVRPWRAFKEVQGHPCKTSLKSNMVDVPSSLLLLAITSSKVGISTSLFPAAFRPLWTQDEPIPDNLDCLFYSTVLYIFSSIC